MDEYRPIGFWGEVYGWCVSRAGHYAGWCLLYVKQVGAVLASDAGPICRSPWVFLSGFVGSRRGRHWDRRPWWRRQT